MYLIACEKDLKVVYATVYGLTSPITYTDNPELAMAFTSRPDAEKCARLVPAEMQARVVEYGGHA